MKKQPDIQEVAKQKNYRDQEDTVRRPQILQMHMHNQVQITNLLYKMYKMCKNKQTEVDLVVETDWKLHPPLSLHVTKNYITQLLYNNIYWKENLFKRKSI